MHHVSAARPIALRITVSWIASSSARRAGEAGSRTRNIWAKLSLPPQR
jgi:hypothetical protein